MTKTIYSVKQLNNELRNLLEASFRSIWIEGEISGLATPASGHMYFSLKEENSKIRCAFFRNRQLKSMNYPEEGSRVLVQGQISYYEPRGDLQFIVSYLEDAGEGELRRAFEHLKKKLDHEGLFDSRHKSNLPSFATRIGIITSDSGAALYDILSTLKRRFPIAQIIVYPTLVQGENAPEKIVEAITIAQQRNEVDVLIISRGGGSLEDLQAFNDESVARAIFNCNIPSISGVGHEVDFTICDLVADYRAATPTAAAEIASMDLNQLKLQFVTLSDRIQRAMNKMTRDTQQTLDYYSSRVTNPAEKLNHYENQHGFLSKQLRLAATSYINLLQGVVQRKNDAIRSYSPQRKVQHNKTTLTLLRRTTINLTQARIQALSQEFKHINNSIQLMSPKHTLNRGYAIVQNKNKKVVTNPVSLSHDELLNIMVCKGEFAVSVVDTTKPPPPKTTEKIT